MKRDDYYNVLNSFNFCETVQTCDLCGRRISENSSSVSNGMDLCSNCYFRWDELGAGLTRECIRNFSIGNVC